MVDITDRTSEFGPTDTHKKDADGNPIRRSKTGGELVFDRVVYTGIGFGVNEAMSLYITDQFMHGNNLLEKAPGFLKTAGEWFSKTGFDKISDKIAAVFKLEEKIINKKTYSPRMRGGNTLLMATLLSGGTLLILPMKWIENTKNFWVKHTNHALDFIRSDKLSAEEVVKRDEEVEQAIACSPKQSWPSMLLGRTIAMFSSWATGTFIVKPQGNERIGKFSENVITHGLKETGSLFATSKQLEQNQPTALHKFAEKDIVKRYANLIGIETYSCAISSIVLEVASKFLTKWNPKVHNPKVCKETAATGDSALPNGANNGSENTDTKEQTKVSVAARQKPAGSYTEQVRQEQKTQPVQAL